MAALNFLGIDNFLDPLMNSRVLDIVGGEDGPRKTGAGKLEYSPLLRIHHRMK